MKKYQQSQHDKLKEHFREHPYFKLCKAVFKAFQEECSTMVMTPEQLFEDAAQLLDRLLQDGDVTTELCQELWTNKYNQYRERDKMVVSEDGTKTEVSMLFYAVMYGLQAVNHSHYRGTLQKTLHNSIHKLYYGRDIKRCLCTEQKLHEYVNPNTEDIMEWMKAYFVSNQSITSEIKEVLQPQKPKQTKKVPKEEDTTPYVLKYICNDDTTRKNRLQRAMILMQNWGWIAETRDADDFYDFFNGEHRACNLKWTGQNSSVIAYLLKMLYEQPFFEKLKGASVSAILKNQFRLKSVNYNYERVSDDDKNRIYLIIAVLDPKVTFKILPKRGHGDGFDYSDSVMYEVYKKELHVIKDLNKRYE